MAADVKPGDMLLVYESQTGQNYYSEDGDGNKIIVKHERGRGGIISIARITGHLQQIINSKPTKYIDGSVRNWNWWVDGELVNDSGFVNRRTTAKLLGYNENYNFRGFGKKRSGLKKITEIEYQALESQYVKNMERSHSFPKSIHIPFDICKSDIATGEGVEHLRLKEAVYSKPETILNIPGIKGIEKEFGFGTGDRADVILQDKEGRYIAVEVEVGIPSGNLVGMLQAIKYKYMLAVVAKRKFPEIRAFLVAHAIDNGVKIECEKYGVEFFEIDRNVINN